MKVSIIVPAFNRAHYLGAAIESALGQSHRPVEVIVVNDGSTDDTEAIARGYDGVRCISQHNQGLSAARNTGIRHSQGEYLVFLDSDDRLLPRAVEIGLAHLAPQAERAFVSAWYRVIDGEGKPQPTAEQACVETDHYAALLRGNYIGMGATVLYRRRVFDSVGAFDTSLRMCEDYDLYFRVARRYPVGCHSSVVAEYRWHGENMSRDDASMLRHTLKVLRRQWPCVKHDPRLRAAYDEGVAFWKDYYGGRLLRQARRFKQSGQRGLALARVLTLMRLAPGVALGWNQSASRTAGRG